MMWFRTTLVFRDAQGWISGVWRAHFRDGLGGLYAPESVIEVLTIAHAHNVASEQLGFTLRDGEQAVSC
jgi:hypothetical protein